MWADEEEVTIASFSNSSHDDWTITNADYATSGGGYYKLISSDASIVTPNINWSEYSDITITISARKFGGPDATQGKISVSQGETELTSYSPSGTSITSSSALSITPTDGTITISCPGASSNKGCGVQSIVIKGTKSSSGSTWSVFYDANGATSGEEPIDYTEYDADNNTVTVLGNEGNLEKTGYTFTGWNTKANGTGDTYVADETFTISANTTLYAQWTVNTYDVTLPDADGYGTYTMDAENPVAYDTDVTLTYTPAAGYETYEATWSVNGEELSGNTFTMPDEAVTVTVSLKKNTTISMTIDFESETNAYTDWTFVNMTSQQTNSGVPAHGGSKFGTTGGKATASVQTNAKIARPLSLTCYVSKQTTNTTSSTWYIQVSSDGSTWTDAESRSATDMGKGEWKEFTVDLSSYSDVYVRVYYDGSTAIRCIDDLTLVVGDSGETSITADAEVNLTAEETSGEISYTINNPVEETSLSATSTDEWISDITVEEENSKVTFTTTENTGDARTGTITLTYGSVTKDVTVNQAKKIITYTYTLATEVVPGRHYIIVGKNDESYQAMGYDKGNNRNAVDITVSGNVASVTDVATTTGNQTGVYEVQIGVDEATGNFTIIDEVNEGYLYAASSSANQLKTQTENDANGLWTIEIDNNGVASIVAEGSSNRNVMQYNSGNSLFSCYASASQSNIYLYERNGDTESQTVNVTIAEACNDGDGMYYGTFSAPYAFVAPNDVIVSEIEIDAEGKLNVQDYATGDVIPANTGVMISSDTYGEKTLTVVAADGTSVLGDGNYLRATGGEGITAEEMAAADANCKYYRLTMHNGTDLGFWWGAEDGAAFNLAANKAYLAVPESYSPARGLWFDNGETTGINEVSSSKIQVSGSEVFDLQGRKVAQPAKGLYIVNGRKVIIK